MSDLTDAAATGDPDAWTQIYTDNHRWVGCYIHGLTKNRLVTEDLTQDVFVRAMRSIGKFTDQGTGIRPWLCTIARNLVFDHCKRHATRLEVPTAEIRDVNDATDGRTRFAPAADARLLSTDEAARLRAAIARLDPAGQELLILRYWQDWTHARIGRRQFRSERAVNTALFRARQSLRYQLELDVPA